ncbi:hypothetical protein F5888DRAFT_415805 [Russula emetica]|nr:hypothetical protein F5888DRAFT_415805 [Russula emetica]
MQGRPVTVLGACVAASFYFCFGQRLASVDEHRGIQPLRSAFYYSIRNYRYPHVSTTTRSSWNNRGTNTELSKKTVVGDFAHRGEFV